MHKPGSNPRRKAWELRLTLISDNWWVFSLLLAGCLVVSAVVTILIAAVQDGEAAPFVAGFLFAGSIWFLWEFLDRESGARSYSAGAGGEGLTAASLKKVKGLKVVHGLKFGFDIDHVAVGA